MTHHYYYLKEYLPVRYSASTEQEQNRQLCYNFKNGFTDEDIKMGFLEKVKTITGNTKEGWVICFIPASSKQATLYRYKTLTEFFMENGYAVATEAIFNEHDKAAEHISGKTNNPIEAFGFMNSAFAGQKVILIDDITTRGTTFNMTADKLEELGALSVTGLFLAKTIHPEENYWDEKPEEYYDPEDDFEESTYDNYNGSYAQDIEGWSDQDIDDVFDGDPDAYWNID